MLLSSVLWNFTSAYTQAVQDIKNGTFGHHGYNLTLANGGISLPHSKYISASVWSEITAAQQKIDLRAAQGAGRDNPAQVKALVSANRAEPSAADEKRQDVAGTQSPERVPAIELVNITKPFPGVLANDDVSLTLRRGEVHCLLGENGAGKSTLIGILAGMLRPDAGRIRVDGADVRIRSPRDALELGIGTVYQHSTLIGGADRAGEPHARRQPRDCGWIVAGARKRLEEFGRTLGVEVDPDARAGDLALGASSRSRSSRRCGADRGC